MPTGLRSCRSATPAAGARCWWGSESRKKKKTTTTKKRRVWRDLRLLQRECSRRSGGKMSLDGESPWVRPSSASREIWGRLDWMVSERKVLADSARLVYLAHRTSQAERRGSQLPKP